MRKRHVWLFGDELLQRRNRGVVIILVQRRLRFVQKIVQGIAKFLCAPWSSFRSSTLLRLHLEHHRGKETQRRDRCYSSHALQLSFDIRLPSTAFVPFLFPFPFPLASTRARYRPV
jgi:hypothetical protein